MKNSVVLLIALAVCQTPTLSVGKSAFKAGVRTYTGTALQEIAFPIGGIGTGSISLGGRGDLRDWEIFNKPDKGGRLDYSFFALWAKARGKQPVARVLESRIMPPYRGGGHGLAQRLLSGLPRLEAAEFNGEYPFASIRFKDSSLPVRVELEAWNPFIPLNVDDSALPVAILTWNIANPSPDSVQVSLAASICNPIGSRYANVKNERPGLGRNLNQYIDAGKCRGLLLSSKKVPKEDPNYGTIALVTPWKELDVQTRWYRGGWWDQCHLFWDDFSDNGRVKDIRDTVSSEDGRSDIGSIVMRATIPPRATVALPVLITWHFANRENYWNEEPEVRGRIMKNYVGKKFGNAWDVAAYVMNNRDRLERESRAFHDGLFTSTCPTYVLDAVSSQMSTLKTNICMLLEDGSFFGFEGLGDSYGCCPLNCTHVWNYEQTVAYLFPQLERSMRETDFLHNTLPNGYMTFRTLVPLGNYWWKFKACADGQMGAIIRAYREWKFSGDTEWLRRIWPKVKLALEFAWLGPGTHPPKGLEWTNEQITMPWDPDKNGVMEGEQHNTYDIEFYGPNTMTGSLYLGALKASTEMAGAMGEPAKAKEYETLFENGSRLYDEKLWNGNYYVQDVSVLKGLSIPKHLISPITEQCDTASECRKTSGGGKSAFTGGDTIPKYQYRTGCLSDQLLGQYLAHVAGLGYVLDREHVRTAMRSIFEHNFKRSMAEFDNVQRVYALNDEAGLLLCSWPKGDRPSLPFVYSDEVWTGIEYQVAATLIYNGWLKEGLAVVKAVRDRYNGMQRNPWDEEECGHHYARAMASWALLLALSGYHYDGVAHLISFAPAVSREDFRTFWSCGTGWGTFAQKETNINFDASLALQYGSLNLGTLSLAWRTPKGKEPVVTINGVRQAATLTQREGTIQIVLRDPTVLKKGDVVRVSY